MVEMQAILDEKDFSQLVTTVYQHCGINLHEGKRELVQARIAKRMRVRGLSDAKQYLRDAMDNQQEFTHLIDALSTNLTSFFRESAHFSHLQDVFIPHLIDTKRKQRSDSIRAWSAGCSSGEEPYSIAMTLLHSFEGSGAWDVKLLATDLSTDVLARARQGVYDSSRVGTLPAGMRSQFVQPNPGHRGTVVMSPTLKNVIRFAHLNLMGTWPFTGPFDFIFCRNVMIYFDKKTQEKLVNRYFDVLAPGGLLFTGHSESLTGINHKFGYVRPTIYIKR